MSFQAQEYFPNIEFMNGHVKIPQAKTVGLVVFKMYKDLQNEGKTDFVPVESFIGSFDRKATDDITKATMFLDEIVNRESKYVNIFSNLEYSSYGTDLTDMDKASIFGISRQTATALGFYSVDTKKTI